VRTEKSEGETRKADNCNKKGSGPTSCTHYFRAPCSARKIRGKRRDWGSSWYEGGQDAPKGLEHQTPSHTRKDESRWGFEKHLKGQQSFMKDLWKHLTTPRVNIIEQQESETDQGDVMIAKKATKERKKKGIWRVRVLEQ